MPHYLRQAVGGSAVSMLLALFIALAGFAAVIGVKSAVAQQTADRPVDGWRHAGDITLHFPAHSDKLAHHWCKRIDSKLTECQLYDSDLPNARLIGIEPIVPAPVFASLSALEKTYWHWHKKSKARIVLPGATPERVRFVNTHRSTSYGKTILVWDPDLTLLPIGLPRVVPH